MLEPSSEHSESSAMENNPVDPNIEPAESPEANGPAAAAEPEAAPIETPAAASEPEAAPIETPAAEAVEVRELPPLPEPMVGVRFPSSNKAFAYRDGGMGLKIGEQVVVENELGISIGSVAKVQFEPDLHERGVKNVLRRATAEDIRQDEENKAFCLEARAYCNERIAARGLPMKLLLAEVTLDRKRLLFYFISETRIDFRELVKDLASKFRTRIELRQIGVRDAAKMAGGIGICGIEYCCRTFLRSFAPISIKMAKQQDLVLNTAKLSGGCGRLLCCLNYEYDEDAARAKRRPKSAAAQQPSPEALEAAVDAVTAPAKRPSRATHRPPPPPIEAGEPTLTYHADFEYEPEFTAPQAQPAAAEGETGEKRRKRRRGRRKPGAEGATRPEGQSAPPRPAREAQSAPPRPAREVQRPPRPERGGQSAPSPWRHAEAGAGQPEAQPIQREGQSPQREGQSAPSPWRHAEAGQASAPETATRSSGEGQTAPAPEAAGRPRRPRRRRNKPPKGPGGGTGAPPAQG